jgi:trimethylamine-N-oxide reductase (cytochrome c)
MSDSSGKWKTCIKGIGLGGSGIGSQTAFVDVRDGKILRTRSLRFDDQYSVDFLKPWSIEARGKHFDCSMRTDIPPFSIVYKKRAYSKNRILYPMKRVDWNPRGERNPQNRGLSKFERISWDEAADIIASEIRRIHKEYSPYAILAQGDGHGEEKVVHAAHGCQQKFLNTIGGCTMQARNPDSWEGWYWGAKHVWGGEPIGQGDLGNLLQDIARNSEMLLHWGCDVETTTWGWEGQISSRYCFWLTEVGVRQVFICPDLNYSAAVHADRWIPILPNPDAALQAAIAYIWITNDWFDRQYVDTHTIGFDWIEYYVSGREDGIPKTPEWASAITGIPSRIIKALARQWYEKPTSIGHCNGGSYIRSIHSSEPGRLEPVLMGMQGLGKPGRNVIKFIEWGLFGLPSQCPNPTSTAYPAAFAAYQGFVYTDYNSVEMHEHHIPKTLIPEAILGQYTLENPLKWHGVGICTYPREDQFNEYQYPDPKSGAQIHMIWTDSPCWTTCWNGGNRFIEALRHPSIEFVLAQHPWLENDCLFADMLLPVSTKYEQKDVASDCNNGYFNLFYIEPQCIEPRGEARSDWECVCAVAEKLGVLEEYTGGNSVDDWIKLGYEYSGIEGLIDWDEFQQKGYFAAPTKEGWESNPAGFELFCNDPENNPLTTPSGKLEFYSVALAENFPGDEERPPYPKWIETSESHPSERLNTPRSEDYPFLLESNHPRWRVHANMDDISWLREIPTCKVKGPDGYLYEPVWINPVDALKLEVKTGDVGRIFNERGAVLGGVYVTERVRPGVIYQDHGARLDPIVAGVLDRGGANNLIAPHKCASKNTSAEVTSGYLVNFEKVDVASLARQYPEAFNRAYDPAVGVSTSNWFVEGRVIS